MKYTVLTLFPEIIDSFFAASIMAKAVSRGIVEYRAVNIRDFAQGRHHCCDDAPYGGGAGMLMLPGPLGRCLDAVGAKRAPERNAAMRVIYLSPSGRCFNQALARELARETELVLLCGRYEGIDQRIIDLYADDEISVGDYVLSSGEAAALVVIDATYRLVESVIAADSLEEESFSGSLLEYPQYTRPEIYDMLEVPEVLLSGHHENIRRWRLEMQVEKTLALRPDLIRRGEEGDLFDSETSKIIEAIRRRSPAGRGEEET
jgi:tRNA (guanine37-N1)-methyltransferase